MKKDDPARTDERSLPLLPITVRKDAEQRIGEEHLTPDIPGKKDGIQVRKDVIPATEELLGLTTVARKEDIPATEGWKALK